MESVVVAAATVVGGEARWRQEGGAVCKVVKLVFRILKQHLSRAIVLTAISHYCSKSHFVLKISECFLWVFRTQAGIIDH